MLARVRYALLTAARTRAPLVATAASLFAVLGVFAYRGNEPGSTWGLTALLACALAAWLAGAALSAEPRAQAEMATAAVGGPRGRATLDLAPVAVAACALTVAFVALPLAASPLGSPPMFVPAATAGDVAAATLAHVCCALAGGALAVLFAPPLLARPASAAAATLAALLALIPLGAVAGPVAVADALADGRSALVPCATCAVLAALALAARVSTSRV